jgi:hypothetical protein
VSAIPWPSPISLEAHESLWQEFTRLTSKAKDELKMVLRHLTSDPYWTPEKRGRVDDVEVCLKTLDGGWVCAWFPIYKILHPNTGTRSLTEIERIIVCLYEDTGEAGPPDYIVPVE